MYECGALSLDAHVLESGTILETDREFLAVKVRPCDLCQESGQGAGRFATYPWETDGHRLFQQRDRQKSCRIRRW